ncbi:uncharacterized protein LOC110813217 isoform X1 [Carica papaya]|uniref:uncharacterized protein LOC110813217 isoform X1 n=1 Tax=Carica papaya TaxID=3649 RepID=UPI000B8CCFA2|nr:uncharacterized protein LOC110813217 isoform X1 [Carica papaya]
MASSASVMAANVWNLHSRCQYLKPVKMPMSSTRFRFLTPNRSSATRIQTVFQIRASDSQPEESSSTMDETEFQEDLKFVLKVGGGSIVGAAVIKYGSIFFPEIARPNIFLALFLVSAPVIVALVILTAQSGAKQ